MRDARSFGSIEQHSSLHCIAREILSERLIKPNLLLNRIALLGGKRRGESGDERFRDGRSATFDWAGDGLGSRHPLADTPSLYTRLVWHSSASGTGLSRPIACCLDGFFCATVVNKWNVYTRDGGDAGSTASARPSSPREDVTRGFRRPQRRSHPTAQQRSG